MQANGKKFNAMKHIVKLLPVLGVLLAVLLPVQSQAQTLESEVKEPEVKEVIRHTSTIQSEYNKGFGFNVVMNNFGFGVGGEFRKVVGPSTELTASLRIGGLRDASEQTYTGYFGQQTIPNKYQRAFSFPLLVGMRHRLFTDLIQENYRFFVSASVGPVMAFSFPYFEDSNENGYREQFTNFFEPVNDIFTGWSQGDWHVGGTGELKIGLDIGSNFARLNSMEFGYYFYYFPDGIQLMMPNQPIVEITPQGNQQFLVDDNGDLILEPFFDNQSFFGSPQITFTFGWLWK